MFKVEFFVQDKDLGEVFKRLAGVARNVSHAYVPNLESRPNGKVNMASSDSLELFMKTLAKHKMVEFRGNEAAKIVSEMGFSPSSHHHFLQSAIKNGLISKRKPPGGGNHRIYTVKPPKGGK